MIKKKIKLYNNILSILLGLILGFIYQYVSPNILIIEEQNKNLLDKLENVVFKENENCFRIIKKDKECSK